MSQVKTVTAAMIIIGDEILSGRTKDANLNHLALWLNRMGVQLLEVRVIPDVAQVIQNTVNELRGGFDYVFTTGGIGPTHDDITAENVAAAFDVPFVQSEEAVRLLHQHYGTDNISEARLRMTMIPEGATLIKNPVSTAPGFQMGNVFVLAGIPVVMQSMLLDLEHRIFGGDKMVSKAIHVFEGESTFATILREVEAAYPDVALGSYPFYRHKRFGASFVLRSQVEKSLDQALEMLKGKIAETGKECFDGEAEL
ncbi:competence/damage-inducible protein A [Paremcibacter congregatus]|uniref:Competence/damage-inducible protein A n=1 Tax=Paremcibacter congregatus TaxID=2043170 RepID=A0A2G4YNG2_9PROT|nr:molybdopterin-binding protein [Paremcibacter congregatus]PHZ83847.1 competence/damage-inducible protein A [Paremcibacter congregatus]QDE27552.1 competence/damage-inducible protein A [Paremcibacter congregatus]